MSETYNILSLDGGGIRGIIPAMLLAEIEKRLKGPIIDHFDLIAGTSTGGILALGLTLPDPNEASKPKFRPDELIDLYKKKGSEIFAKNLWRRVPGSSLFEEKYPSRGIESVLNHYFGNAMLSDALRPVVITSYEIERRKPFFFKSRHAVEKHSHNFLVKKVARATSAAPTFFEPLRLDSSTDEDEYFALVDGGVYANNPSMCALAEALSLGKRLDEIVLISLGTGEHTRPIMYDDAKDWGLAGWAQPVISVLMDGVSDTVDYQALQILSNERYFRIQVRLDEALDDMDDASRANIRALQFVAEDLIASQSDKLDTIVELLKR